MGSLEDIDGKGVVFHSPTDPLVIELNRLENLLREKELELGNAYCEIKALKMTEALKGKAVVELSNELERQDEKMRSMENQIEQKNLEIKKLSNEKKEAISGQFAAEATLRRIHTTQKDEEEVPFQAIIAPMESDIKQYKQEIAVLQDDKKALERHVKLKETALVEAGNILRSALERALIVEDVQNQNTELRRQMEIYNEENKLLEKTNRQKVLEIEKLNETIQKLEESLLASGTTANAIRVYQSQVSTLHDEKKELERELAKAKIYVNRVATVTANEWKDDSDKVMPVKRWLEERKLFQGEIKRLRDKISVAEKSVKAEAQINEKLKKKLKAVEQELKSSESSSSMKEINRQSTQKRSTSQPRQHGTAKVSPEPSTFEGIDRNRPTSQPRVSVAGKVLNQPNSVLRTPKSADSPKAKDIMADRLVRNNLWASRRKIIDDTGKENKESHFDISEVRVLRHGETKLQKNIVSNSECEFAVSGLYCNELHIQAMDMKKSSEEKDGNSSATDGEIQVYQN